MRKKSLAGKKAMAVLMAAAMMLSVAGCGGSGNNDNENQGDVETGNQNAGDDQTGAQDDGAGNAADSQGGASEEDAEYDFYTTGITGNGLKCFIENRKAQLRGKPDCTHHAQRVVAESDVRIERSAY